MALKIGIVGIGYGQHVLLPVFQADERVTVQAICASTQERAQTVADEHNVPIAFGDWREMLPHVDAVVVAVPPTYQPEIVLAALDAGKPVFAEKPLATTLADAQQMADAANATNLPNVIDFEFPELAAWQTAQQMIADMGPLRHVEVVWAVENYASRMRLNNWKTQAAGGGVLYNYMSHVFYNLEWLIGQRIRALSATLAKAPTDPRTGDTVNAVAIRFENDLLANVTATSHAFAGSGHRLAFYGDDATLVLENTTKDYMHGFTIHYAERDRDGTLQPVPLPYVDTSEDGRRLAAGFLARRWIDWIIGGTPTQPTFADGLHVQRLIHLAQESNRTGRWMDR